MVVAESPEPELLPVGSSDNGGVEGKPALDGACAPGSSQTPVAQPEAAPERTHAAPLRFTLWTCAGVIQNSIHGQQKAGNRHCWGDRTPTTGLLTPGL